MTPPLRVVFDCNVFFQGFVSERGPAGALLAEAASGSLALFLSEVTLREITDVLLRPRLMAKIGYNAQRVQEYTEYWVGSQPW